MDYRKLIPPKGGRNMGKKTGLVLMRGAAALVQKNSIAGRKDNITIVLKDKEHERE